MLLDIVILPPKELREKISKAMLKAVVGTDYFYIVDNRRLIPHLSLFHINILPRKFTQLSKIIEGISRKYKSTRVKSLRLKVAQDGQPWYNWFELSNNQELKKLNREIVKRCSNLRQGTMPWSRKDAPKGLDKKLRNHYGTQHNIGSRFAPHFTMVKFKNKSSAEMASRTMKVKKFEFLADTIAICEVNKYHQVIRVIKSFKLDSRFRGNGMAGAVKVLKAGGVVVYPTDTAYGLAVDATNPSAVKKLYALKGRDFKKPVHVIPPTKAWIAKLVRLNLAAKRLIEKLMPGPLTLVLPLKISGESWKLLSAGTKTLGIRRPKYKLALDLAALFGKPITTTSANVAGGKNCYSVPEFKKQFNPRIYGRIYAHIYVLDGGKLKKTKPSTVVSLTGKNAKILRQGPISETQIKNVLLFTPHQHRG